MFSCGLVSWIMLLVGLPLWLISRRAVEAAMVAGLKHLAIALLLAVRSLLLALLCAAWSLFCTALAPLAPLAVHPGGDLAERLACLPGCFPPWPPSLDAPEWLARLFVWLVSLWTSPATLAAPAPSPAAAPSAPPRWSPPRLTLLEEWCAEIERERRLADRAAARAAADRRPPVRWLSPLRPAATPPCPPPRPRDPEQDRLAWERFYSIFGAPPPQALLPAGGTIGAASIGTVSVPSAAPAPVTVPAAAPPPLVRFTSVSAPPTQPQAPAQAFSTTSGFNLGMPSMPNAAPGPIVAPATVQLPPVSSAPFSAAPAQPQALVPSTRTTVATALPPTLSWPKIKEWVDKWQENCASTSKWGQKDDKKLSTADEWHARATNSTWVVDLTVNGERADKVAAFGQVNKTDLNENQKSHIRNRARKAADLMDMAAAALGSSNVQTKSAYDELRLVSKKFRAVHDMFPRVRNGHGWSGTG